MNEETLYPIAPHGGFGEWSKYLPGVTSAGEQVILFTKAGVVSAYRFDTAGDFLRRDEYDVGNGAGLNNRMVPLDLAAKLGLAPATIRIKRFHYYERDAPSMAIRDYPSHFEDGEMGTEEEYQATLAWWEGRKAFVLFQGTSEHWLDGDGNRFQ